MSNQPITAKMLMLTPINARSFIMALLPWFPKDLVIEFREPYDSWTTSRVDGLTRRMAFV